MTTPTFARPALDPLALDRPDAPVLAELAADYELLGELGRGGSAVVYHARDRRLDRQVALKVVRIAPALSPAERVAEVDRLAREARTIARLTHPGVVAVYAVHELRDGLAVAMQYVRGRTLKQVVADEGALDPARAAAIVRDVAEALAYAHAQGLVHRDVKPENIFVDDATGRALLADFGAARGATADVRVTRTGMTVGTPAYMSPEQIDDAPLDGRSDLYSLGLVAWEALTGRRPWDQAGLYQLLHHQKHDQLPPIAALRPAAAPAVPLALEYVVERLVEKRPGARWASGDAVADQLEHPTPPADFALWKRAHDRRMGEWAKREGDGADAGAVVSAPTEQLRAGARTLTGPVPAVAVAAQDAGAADAPSWANERPGLSRRWYAAGAALALAAALPFARRNVAPAAARRPSRPAVRVGDTARTTTVAVASLGSRPTEAQAAASGRAAPVTAPPVAAPPVAAAPVARAPLASVTLPVSRPAPARVPSAATAPAPRVMATPSLAPALPTPVAASAAPAVAPAVVPLERAAIAAGGRHSCALDPAGHAACWGDNASGQLGSGDLTPHDTPVPVAGELRFVALTTGGAHSCGLTADGDAYCWGEDDNGQLGDATTSLRDAPVRVTGTARFRAVRAGLDHTCGLATSGAVLCWGANTLGQLGDGSTHTHATPAPAVNLRAVAIAVGWRHSCALTADGQAFCWGDNAAAQLGDGSRTTRSTPVAVVGGLRFVAIAAGASHTCATTALGATYCWGTGGADASAHATPTRVDAGAAFVALAAGSVHTCGRTAAGAVYCWGRNAYGQLGDASTADRWRPARVVGGPYSAVAAAGAHTCAVAAGAPVCWGYNVAGQLGDGSRTHHSSPVRVARPSV